MTAPWARPSINAGQIPSGSQLEATWDAIDALIAAGWTDYSTELQVLGSGTNPTMGNSPIDAAYRRSADSDWIVYAFKFTIGNTFSNGAGNYTVSLPVAMLAPSIWTGQATFFDGGTAFRCANLIAASSTALYMYQDGAANPLGATGPGTAWSVGDYIAGQILYAPA